LSSLPALLAGFSVLQQALLSLSKSLFDKLVTFFKLSKSLKNCLIERERKP